MAIVKHPAFGTELTIPDTGLDAYRAAGWVTETASEPHAEVPAAVETPQDEPQVEEPATPRTKTSHDR